MDSPEDEGQPSQTTKKGFASAIIGWCVLLSMSIVTLLFLSILVVVIVSVFSNSPVASPISVPSQCKVVSSSVDLRSSKVCELGFLNIKAKDVFFPFDRSKFRCRYDYYWASVFRVEFKDQFSGQTRIALAEAPAEALPLNCRPNFGDAWLAKDKFKVNGTYDCWYSSGISKVILNPDQFSGCRVQHSSTVDKTRKYSILFSKLSRYGASSRGRDVFWRWEMMAGLVTGAFTSFFSILVCKVLQELISGLFTICAGSFLVRLKQACFLVAYLSFTGWLAIQYGKKLGLPEILNVFVDR